MIYIAIESCKSDPASQKVAAKKAKKILFSRLGIECDIAKSENGKPLLSDERYHISFSHSGNVAICALRCREECYDLPDNVFTIFEDGEGDIGADIELIPPEKDLERLNRISMRFMKRKFITVTELIKRWTLCESYTKLHDVPLAESFKAHITDTLAFSGIVSVGDEDYYLTVLI